MDSNYEKLCYEIAKQNSEKQIEIMDFLKRECTQDEYNAIAIGISYFRMLLYPELKQAMMQVVSEGRAQTIIVKDMSRLVGFKNPHTIS